MAESMTGETVVQTLNEEAPDGNSEGDSGISSIPDKSNSSSELVGTIVADPEPEEANNTEAAEEEEAETEGEEVEPKDESKDDKLDRFDKHPRFQELKAERDKAIERAALAEARAKETAKVEAAPDYQDVMEMDDDALDEQWETDKKGFLQNYAKQIAAEVFAGIAEREQKTTIQQKVNTTYDKYATENPDFQMMLDSGEIRNFINQNPGHNAISAHMALSGEAKTQAKIDAAVAEATKKAAENHKVKRSAVVLNEDASSPTVPKSGIPPELKNTKLHGGPTGALFARLMASRKSSAG